mmetsp:Transcript_13465/g.38624  ORF Transcript_13465/g.38624 Transcript_13465/m.38624 type:complete len:301 (+) Transcript_13465:703-1605(+)
MSTRYPLRSRSAPAASMRSSRRQRSTSSPRSRACGGAWPARSGSCRRRTRRSGRCGRRFRRARGAWKSSAASCRRCIAAGWSMASRLRSARRTGAACSGTKLSANGATVSRRRCPRSSSARSWPNSGEIASGRSTRSTRRWGSSAPRCTVSTKSLAAMPRKSGPLSSACRRCSSRSACILRRPGSEARRCPSRSRSSTPSAGPSRPGCKRRSRGRARRRMTRQPTMRPSPRPRNTRSSWKPSSRARTRSPEPSKITGPALPRSRQAALSAPGGQAASCARGRGGGGGLRLGGPQCCDLPG